MDKTYTGDFNVLLLHEQLEAATGSWVSIESGIAGDPKAIRVLFPDTTPVTAIDDVVANHDPTLERPSITKEREQLEDLVRPTIDEIDKVLVARLTNASTLNDDERAALQDRLVYLSSRGRYGRAV